MVSNTLFGDDSQETTVANTPATFVPVTSATSDHQYFNSSFIFPSQSSPVLFSSSASSSPSPRNSQLTFESSPLPEHETRLFSTNDTDDVDEYFIKDPSTISTVQQDLSISMSNPPALLPTVSSNGIVPVSPNINTDFDFTTNGDDLLDDVLQSLGDFVKLQETLTLPTRSADQKPPPTNGLDFIQQEEFPDFAWEESFSQLFPSLSSA